MQAETIRFARGRVDISSTPDEFPLGERGKRPVRFTLNEDDDFLRVKELAIPGVICRGSRVDCAFDVAPIICDAIAERTLLDATLGRRLMGVVPFKGKEEYERLDFKTKLYGYQRESVRFLLRRAYAILGELPRAGKCVIILATFVAAGCNRLLILCNALGKYVWGEEVAKWIDSEAVMLFGRAGTDVRVYCKACMGRGCGSCVRGERFYTTHMLERVCERRTWNEVTAEAEEKYRAKLAVWELANSERATIGKKPLKKPDPPKGKFRAEQVPVEPPLWRCPVHLEETDTAHSRPCSICRAAMLEQLEKARVVVCNYDILIPHKEKDDAGAMVIREDLPGWGPILAKLHFEMAVCSESHKLRGWQPKSAGNKESQNRRERVDEVCAEIPRVYGETGTFIYGFTRDGWGQLDLVSRGLWS